MHHIFKVFGICKYYVLLATAVMSITLSFSNRCFFLVMMRSVDVEDQKCHKIKKLYDLTSFMSLCVII